MRLDFAAQISAETLLSAGIVMVFLILVLAHNSFVNSSTQQLGETYTSRGECLRLAFSISQVYAAGAGAQVALEIKEDANVSSSQKSVIVGSESCRFVGRAADASIAAGSHTARNEQGLVTVA